MNEILAVADMVLRVSAAVFTAANLLAVGLETDAHKVLVPLRDARFVAATAAVDWLFCPLLGWLIVSLLPIAPGYAAGLLVISLAPAAPFLPVMVRRAGGDMAYAAAFIALSSAGTILVMPLVVPLMLPGVAADPVPLLVPMLVLVLLPLSVGVAVNSWLPAIAQRANKVVRPTATAATIVLVFSICIVHFGGFRAAIGSFAILAQFLFCIGSLLLGWLSAIGLPRQRRSVLALGAGTRNLGAALVPLLVSATDQRAIVMVALAVPITIVVTRLAAELFVRASRERTD